jgi:hypothetical protein
VVGKEDLKPGLQLQTPMIKNIQPGDRITATGRIGGGAPKSDWAMVIDRKTGVESFRGLAQHVTPEHNELFSVTYILDEADLEKPLMVRSNYWGNVTESMDFYVDSILITRNVSHTSTVVDERQTVYSFAEDDGVKKLRPGDITKFIRSAGTPKYTIFEKNSKKGIHLGNRLNNWDGLDIWLPSLDLKPGNSYTISVNGKIDGPSSEKARVMFQIIPGYIWRSEKNVVDNEEFNLSHTFSAMELQTAQTVRIATDDGGAKMSFFLYDIEITANQV